MHIQYKYLSCYFDYSLLIFYIYKLLYTYLCVYAVVAAIIIIAVIVYNMAAKISGLFQSISEGEFDGGFLFCFVNCDYNQGLKAKNNNTHVDDIQRIFKTMFLNFY